MRLTPMRFKEFTGTQKTEVYSVEYRRRIAVHQVPFGSCVMQELGGSYRVLKGEGVFAGEGAYQRFKELAEVFQSEGPGCWSTFRDQLALAEEPLPDFVRYRFEFWEDCGGYESGLKPVSGGSGSGGGSAGQSAAARTHTVRKGDTLWGVARQYGVELTALIRANPQIKNPNLIYPGEAVRVP